MRQYFCIVCDMIKLCKGQLCFYCRAQVEEKEILLHKRNHNGIPHYYLFEWNESSHHFCTSVVYFLKNKKQSYFEEWVAYIGSEMMNNEKLKILTPKSSRMKQAFHHGKSFSLELLKLFPNSSVLEVEVSGEGPQKGKKRNERLKITKLEECNPLELDSIWVFADDVFVTGGTYERVSKSTGSDARLIVTLFYRSLWDRKGDDD